jgi:hypothetical protein
MKEATGELNTTVITVVAIAAVAALFYAFVWPLIQNRLKANTICSSASPGMLQGSANTEGYISCGSLNSSKNYTCSYYQNGKSGSATCQTKTATD